MTCKDCGRPLRPDEDKYCPRCRNKRDKDAKTAAAAGVGIAAAVAGILALIFGGKGKSK
jgi:hypothetical protein